jgi:hypothetical protein
VFGLLADALGGSTATQAQQPIPAASTRALEETFLIMLVPLVLTGLMLLRARSRYAADVATAIASERSLRSDGEADESPPRRPPQRRSRRARGTAGSPARTAS